MKQAEVIRELSPLDASPIHGVTFDGERVWFARDNELVAFDPRQEKVVRQFAIPGAAAGTAFDGTHLYQLAHEEILVIDPEDGRIVRRLRAPNGGENSGMAWSDGCLWVGQYRAAKIHKVDAQTGELMKTLSSDRFVTGVSCVDGELWHAISDEGPCELRKLAPDGSVEASYRVDVKHISGMERTREGFWCGGESGKLRLVRG
jgi:streptogramin lyase